MKGNVQVLLSNGKVMSFNIWGVNRMPFAWGSYSETDLNTVCGVYLTHDVLGLERIYTKPDWALNH